MRKIKANLLAKDFELYPRKSVDPYHVNSLADAMLAGAKLPPIVIDKKSLKIVDGYHRVDSYLKLDKEAVVEVIEKSYRNDAEMFLDAVRFNSEHGRMLTQYDRVHILHLSQKMSIDREAIALALHVTVDAAARLVVDRSAVLERTGSMQVSSPVPLKRTIQHMAGRSLTPQQATANNKLSGMNQMFYVNQLILILEAGLLDEENEELLKRLEKLGDLIASVPAAI